MIKSFVCLSISLLLCLAAAQYPLLDTDKCSKTCTGTVDSYPEDYVGVWYYIKHIPILKEEHTKCSYINVTNINATANSIEVVTFNKTNNAKIITKVTSSIDCDGKSTTYYLGFKLDFMTIAFDRETFATAACFECGFFSKDGAGYYGQIFSRSRHPSSKSIKQNLEAYNACGVPPTVFTTVDQDDCEDC